MRFIQIGVGGFGGAWRNAVLSNKQAKMVGLVDVNEGNLKAAIADTPWTEDMCFTSLKEALKSVEADAAIVVTPPVHHREPVVTCLKAGLNVISEKPMAESMADCKAMVQAAKKTGRLYMVSQNYRYSEPMWTLAQTLRKEKLGAVGQAKLDFFMGVGFDGFRQAMPYPLVIDMSIHHFDLIRFLTGLDAVKVTASAWNPPWSHYDHDCSTAVVFEMNNGARVLYNGSWCSKGGFCDWNGNWQIECAKGSVTYDRGRIELLNVPERYHVTSSREIPFLPMKLQGQAYVLAEFMRCVRSGKRPATDCFDNIRSAAMVFATVKAMQTGSRVEVLDRATLDLLG